MYCHRGLWYFRFFFRHAPTAQRFSARMAEAICVTHENQLRNPSNRKLERHHISLMMHPLEF
jgi:hypothetical protein